MFKMHIFTADTYKITGRVARHLAAMFALREISEDTYYLTPFTESLAKPGASDTIPFMYVLL